MKRLIGIDPGIRGIAVVFLEGSVLKDGSVDDLCAGTTKNYYTLGDKECLDRLGNWFDSKFNWFKQFNPDAIVIEQQCVRQTDMKKGRMIGVMWALTTMCKMVCKNIYWVAPSTYKKHFGLATGNYQKNKEQARQKLEEIHGAALQQDPRWQQLSKKHQGDLADAYFMTMFYFISSK